jgi:hypothetical protein
MPVAALIVIRPGIEVKAIKGYSLGAYPDPRNAWSDVAVKAVLVHAEVSRRVAEPQKARCREMG